MHKTQQRQSNSSTTATRTVPTGTVMERTRVRGNAVGGEEGGMEGLHFCRALGQFELG